MSSEEKRRRGTVHDVGMAGLLQPVDEVNTTPFCGIDDGPHPCDEQAASIALGPERALAPQDSRAQCPLCIVVRGFHAFLVDEGPQDIPLVPKVLGEGDEFGVRALESRDHGGFPLCLDWLLRWWQFRDMVRECILSGSPGTSSPSTAPQIMHCSGTTSTTSSTSFWWNRLTRTTLVTGLATGLVAAWRLGRFPLDLTFLPRRVRGRGTRGIRRVLCKAGLQFRHFQSQCVNLSPQHRNDLVRLFEGLGYWGWRDAVSHASERRTADHDVKFSANRSGRREGERLHLSNVT